MKIGLLVLASLILAILSWMALSWPLPLHLTSAVTVSAHGGGGQQISIMKPSDALQLLYYFQLVKEWITGATPFFHNLYEFNVGIDADRYAPGGYYVPFSLVYALGASVAGQAFGMNLAVVVSLWFTMVGTWLLVRRYVADEWVAALFSLFAILLPYRWITLFDGSPTGYAMMWVPFLFLGLDMAVRDGRLGGGLLGGATLLLAYFGDVHVFFFSVLATPVWCLLAWIMPSSASPGSARRYAAMFKALLPVAVAAVLIAFVVRFESSVVGQSGIGGGRSLAEVSLFSPRKRGFVEWQPGAAAAQVYLGWPLAGLMPAGALALIVLAVRQPRTELRRLFFWGLLMVVCVLAGVLALGPHGPRQGGLFILARVMIPPYVMIRQAAKIFSLMPTFMAVAGAMALGAVIRVAPLGAWWRAACLAVFGSTMIMGYMRICSPALTRLQESQGAYRAVAADARARGQVPRALVVPLWPGDSHYASVYQHYAIAHHVRMVNGYTPAYAQAYFEDVFLRFSNVNQGYLDDDLADALLAKGIEFILLHENMYPEKVAPFPVSFAIRSYLEHPRLELLLKDESVWAFRLLDAPKPPGDDALAGFPSVQGWKAFFPARHWEMERSRSGGAGRIEDPAASGHAYLTLARPEAAVTLSPTGAPPARNLRWLIRARGDGAVQAHVLVNGEAGFPQELVVGSPEWTWMPVHAPIASHAHIGLHLEHLRGSVDLDSALLTAGDWPLIEPGESLALPAPTFFHAGRTSWEQGHVALPAGRDASGIVFYGPRMPFEPGEYDISFLLDSSADAGTVLGILHVDMDWNTKEGPAVEVVAGELPTIRLELEHNLPLSLSFVNLGNADIIVDRVVFARVR